MRFVFALVLTLILCLPVQAQYINQYQTYHIRANDGTYLGNTGSQFDPNSINNPYGRYGSPYSPNSINNPYGQYGSPYSPQSPNNPYTQPAKAYPQSGGGIYYNYGGNGY